MRIYLLQIILVLCTINAQATAVVGSEASLALPNCEDRCGNISIPYPFGIGANCSAGKSFTITCRTSFKVPKPFIDVGINLEVLEISLLRGTIRVKNPVVTSYCYKRSNDELIMDLSSTPFSFSDSNRFTAMGCDILTLLNEQETVIGGLAFVVDQEWFSGLSDPLEVQSMKTLPVVLDWVKYGGQCKSFEENNVSSGANYPRDNSTNNASSLCGLNTNCSTIGLCNCKRGFSGNPYLRNGCQGTSISVAWLLLIVGTWWLYKIMKRRKKTKLKKKFFKRNGGLLLEQQLSSGEEGNVDKTKIFTSKELEKATDQYNQNRILGQGGQGTVYKGMLADGKIVAIKKSKIEDECQLEQFINEVAILSQINHRNVVKLHGCCLETEVPMLVYEFIPNGTLFQYIHEENPEFPLSWDVLLRIATEAAGALTYLHSAASVPIYHRDIKSTNIILDEKFRAKVADFGTSRSLTIDQTHLTTKVLGTFGYLDPEYFQSSQFTEKSDVYSFGVVLVELLTGEKAISSTREGGRSLALHFKSVIKENCLCDILDARVARGGAKEEIKRVANLAKRCLNSNGKKRPTMREVAMELEGTRKSNSAQVQEHHEAEVEDVIELQGPWDTWSTSIGYVASNNASASLDVQPLLYD
ncbi:hypothetical protein LguiB_001387 [Lonicera macranthoides]